MKIDYSYYILNAKPNLDGSEGSKRHGALLKVQFEDGIVGYADCHPWPEIGDKPIEDQLSALRQRHPTSLMRCSLRFARLDAEARQKHQSLLAHKSVPSSHFLITDLLVWTPSAIDRLIEQGYTHLKIKLGKHISQEIAQLLYLFPRPPLKLRLDFNERLSIEEFCSFLKAIEKLHSSIDFFEDPVPFNPVVWKELQTTYQISLACDRQTLAAMHWLESADVLVVKPAIQSIELFERVPKSKLIVTSYLDHPLGQVAAAYVAAEIDPEKNKIHGLLSHHTYQPNSFSYDLSQLGPDFVAPAGTGFGYDEKLNQVEWKML